MGLTRELPPVIGLESCLPRSYRYRVQSWIFGSRRTALRSIRTGIFMWPRCEAPTAAVLIQREGPVSASWCGKQGEKQGPTSKSGAELEVGSRNVGERFARVPAAKDGDGLRAVLQLDDRWIDAMVRALSNANLPVMMLAERAAELVLEEKT